MNIQIYGKKKFKLNYLACSLVVLSKFSCISIKNFSFFKQFHQVGRVYCPDEALIKEERASRGWSWLLI